MLNRGEKERRGGALIVRSKFLTRRQLCLAKAKVRSTTQRRGRISKSPPYSECLMISILHFADRGQRRAKLVARIASARGNMAQPDCGTAGLSQPKIRTASQRRPAILADFLHSDALFSLSCRIFLIRTGGTPKPRALKRSTLISPMCESGPPMPPKFGLRSPTGWRG